MRVQVVAIIIFSGQGTWRVLLRMMDMRKRTEGDSEPRVRRSYTLASTRVLRETLFFDSARFMFYARLRKHLT